jgi:peptidoglycan/xylan/chitin deacetylase (PgdA/CDA1 family)
MYHYVRPLNQRLSERHKALDLNEFIRQLDILSKEHYFISGTSVKSSVSDRHTNSKQPVWLTFDDGYLDHFQYVFPELVSCGAVASFFIPTKAIFERKLLDVNKIHILLSANVTTTQLIETMREVYDSNSGLSVTGSSFNELRTKYGIFHLLDEPDISFIKSLLQYALPDEIRKIIIKELFQEHIQRKESAFVDEMYMTPDQVKQLHDYGMNIGSHGHEHQRFELLSVESQKRDLEVSSNYLRSVGIEDAFSVVCYPHGSFDFVTKTLLNDLGCEVAVTTTSAIADLGTKNVEWLELPRIDVKYFDKFIDGEFN